MLIADDDPDMAQGLRLMLQLWGCTVVVCHDGATALAAVTEFRPEVVLLDIGLPKGDGVEIARRIRAGGALPEVMLIALSGYRPSRRPGSEDAGFDAWLVKPIEVETLRRLIFEPAPSK
ncbi:MAG TPA: response regulator [Polyangia bacterium]|nr:response regulator [Polyangia bacterium]